MGSKGRVQKPEGVEGTGFTNTQRPIRTKMSDPDWKRRRAGYVVLGDDSALGPEEYLFCIQEGRDGEIYFGMEWPNVPPRETNLEYFNAEELINEDLKWDELNNHLEIEKNMKEVALNYLEKTSHLDQRKIRVGAKDARTLYNYLSKD